MSRARTFQKSLTNAARGIVHALKTERNMQRLTAAGGLVLIAAIGSGVPPLELLVLCSAMASLLVAELLNTAIEIFADHVSGETYHDKVKSMKDIAAGAVLVTAANATIVSITILFPHVLALLNR